MQYIFVIFIIFYELFRTIFCPFALYLPQKAPNFPFFTISGSEQMFCNCITKVLFKCRKINFCICLFYIGKRKKGDCRRRRGLEPTGTSDICKFAPHPQMRRNALPPLCKGRWHGVCRDGGIVALLPPNNPSDACGASSPHSGASAPAGLTIGKSHF